MFSLLISVVVLLKTFCFQNIVQPNGFVDLRDSVTLPCPPLTSPLGMLAGNIQSPTKHASLIHGRRLEGLALS